MSFSIKLCRLCTNHSDATLTLMHLDSDNITFMDKLNTILPDYVDINSELPNTICTSCIIKLNEAYMFIKSCLKSQEELKQTLKQLQSKEVAEMSDKLEIKMEEVHISSDEAKQQIDYETDLYFVNVPVKNEEEVDFSKEENIEHAEEFNEYCLEKVEENKIVDEVYSEASTSLKSENIIDNNSSCSSTSFEKRYYNCDICEDFSTIYQVELKEHYQSKHKNGNKYQCDICSKLYARKYLFFAHLRAHKNIKPYKCDICSKSFAGKEYFNTHVRMHTTVETYKCELCDKSYNYLSNMKRHMRTHSKEDRRSYKCEVCEKMFMYQSDCKRHFRCYHLNERRFKCEICGWAFKLNSDLKRHVYTHTGDKPFKCELCDKQFVQGSQLRSHIRTHANEKRYTCDVCDKIYTNKVHLGWHMRIHFDLNSL